MSIASRVSALANGHIVVADIPHSGPAGDSCHTDRSSPAEAAVGSSGRWDNVTCCACPARRGAGGEGRTAREIDCGVSRPSARWDRSIVVTGRVPGNALRVAQTA